ncbi:MAG: lipoprotein-releasing ABC transporter permease subunit [Gammaproteobacteria bacterium]|nr:lipoprotein-releasing ABC transporter permease subunit [Gammaproteobacteria bacterium]MCF6230936.1 lipoprotein-releasing ABC transporter permease subunit [Gammaproteobacteria bacterium]
MFKSLPLFIGLRYTRAKRRNHFISFISLISMLSIALGVTALITVLSVMNGFEKELRERILGMASHATITGHNNSLDNWQSLAELAHQHPEVVGAAPYIEGEGMLSNGEQVSGVALRGIDVAHESEVSEVAEKMIAGDLAYLQPGEYGIVLGVDLARSLGVLLGEKVSLIVSKANISPIGIMPRMKRFTVVGIFEVGMYEYDSGLAILQIEDAAKLYKMEGEVTGLRLKLNDMFMAPQVAQELVEGQFGRYYMSDWTRKHANFFRAIQIEKTMMFLILSLIIAVAAFNIVSTLVMVVTDKAADIAILRTLGATPTTVLLIFMVQGCVIGFVGTTLGLLGGVSLALNVDTLVPALESLLNTKFLDASVYYITELPSDLHWDDVIKITSISFSLSLLATLYPAWNAAKMQPAEVLRHE